MNKMTLLSRRISSSTARMRFHAIVVEEYAARELSYVAVRGKWEQRWEMAVTAISERL